MLSAENKVMLIKRLKALGWTTATMLAPVVVDFITTNLSLFDLPTWLVVGIGLVLAQVTKYFASRAENLKVLQA